ncbi:MAG: cobalamin B12-binding domain-containing protein [Mariniphaga sp.]|nr:cobalamin B12-binding domain-containing protein [Mariniphaga sp.]
MVRNKKILLVKLEDNYQVYPPYGLMYLASALKSNGYEFEIFHERITRKNLNLLIKKAKDAFVVGFSVTTTPSLMAVLKSSQEIKRKYKTPIIWGGCHATMLPEINLKDKGVDFIIMKEGEESLIQLLKCLESGIEPKDVPGVGYKKKEGIKVNQFTKIIDNLDKYNYDFIWDYLDIKKYLSPRFGKYRRVLPVITSRGCPHDCYFCYNSFMYNRKWRKHNVEFVIKGINRLKEKYNIDGIYYIDDNLFTINDRGFKIIEKIGLPWIAQARADYITEKFAKRARN